MAKHSRQIELCKRSCNDPRKSPGPSKGSWPILNIGLWRAKTFKPQTSIYPHLFLRIFPGLCVCVCSQLLDFPGKCRVRFFLSNFVGKKKFGKETKNQAESQILIEQNNKRSYLLSPNGQDTHIYTHIPGFYIRIYMQGYIDTTFHL